MSPSRGYTHLMWHRLYCVTCRSTPLNNTIRSCNYPYSFEAIRPQTCEKAGGVASCLSLSDDSDISTKRQGNVTQFEQHDACARKTNYPITLSSSTPEDRMASQIKGLPFSSQAELCVGCNTLWSQVLSVHLLPE